MRRGVKPSPDQLPLDFYLPQARKTDPRTSHKAANAIKPESRRGGILEVLKLGNFATFQIAEMLDVSRDCVSPHMKPLERMNYVVRTGEVVKNPKGGECEVWALASKK